VEDREVDIAVLNEGSFQNSLSAGVLASLLSGLQSRIDYASVGLRPHFVFGQIGEQRGEVKRGVDAVTFDVVFNLNKLLSERLAILVIVLDVAHAPAYSYLTE
jgi:hypothetical protein